MNGFDIACSIAAAAAMFGGWRQGIVVRIASSAGALGGLLLAAANVDAVAARLPRADSTPRLVGVIASLAIGWLLGRILGGLAGRWLRKRLPAGLAQSDRLIGASAGLVGVLLTIWLAAPVMTLLPGWPSRAVGDSRVVDRLDQTIGLAPLPIDQNLWRVAVPGSSGGDGTGSLTDSLTDSITDSITDSLTKSVKDSAADAVSSVVAG